MRKYLEKMGVKDKSLAMRLHTIAESTCQEGLLRLSCSKAIGHLSLVIGESLEDSESVIQ